MIVSQKECFYFYICISFLSEKYNERNLCYVSEEREKEQKWGERKEREKVPCNEMKRGYNFSSIFHFLWPFEKEREKEKLKKTATFA